MKKSITAIIIALFALSSTICMGQESNKNGLWKFVGRAGIHVGAATPLPVPSQVDKIYAWYPNLNPTIELRADRRLDETSPWSISFGLAAERKGMGATTHASKLPVVISSLSPYNDNTTDYPGQFTGDNNVTIRLGYLSLPVMAQYSMMQDKLMLRAGIYTSLLLESTFKVIIDGVMVYDDPNLVSEQMDLREMDFSDQIRAFDLGMRVGANYYFFDRVGVSADLNFGVLPIVKKDFKTIPYKLHNVFATIGVSYRFALK